MLASKKNKYYKKLLDLLLKIQGNHGFFFYDGYYCNLEQIDNDYAVYASFFQKKEYFGLYQNVFQIETKQDYKTLEIELLSTRNESLEITETEFQNFLRNYGEYKREEEPFYEIKYDDWNYIRMYVQDKIKYCKSEGDEAMSGETSFQYGINMLYETMFLFNTYRAKYKRSLIRI